MWYYILTKYVYVKYQIFYRTLLRECVNYFLSSIWNSEPSHLNTWRSSCRKEVVPTTCTWLKSTRFRTLDQKEVFPTVEYCIDYFLTFAAVASHLGLRLYTTIMKYTRALLDEIKYVIWRNNKKKQFFFF